MSTPDAVVIGSGPNGLAAALVLARAGLSVEVLEGAATPGGGCRTEELTLPGLQHDVCSTVQSMVPLSPFFAGLDLERLGVRLCTPEVAFAHPLDDGRAGAVLGSVADTAATLGADGARYARLFGPLVDGAATIVPTVLAPLRSLPRHPVPMARFAVAGLPSLAHLARRFSTEEAKGLLAGVGAHAMLPLEAPLTAAFGIFLTIVAHAGGWPLVQGGSAQLVAALVSELTDAGATLHTGRFVKDATQLPAARAVVFDTSLETLVAVAGARLPAHYRRALGRFRHGPGICKVDWALSGPVPWSAPMCRKAGTVHVGGTFAEVARSESEVASDRHAERPYCLVVQPGVVDPTRAPAGQQTLWAYCHVPRGSTLDMTLRIEAQIERFAPGFKDLVLARATLTAAQAQAHNPNYVGGDITGGAGTLRQTIFRPAARWNPYRTGAQGIYLCSASTPPGGGVHGMCGVGAARAVLADLKVRERR
ncbi:MAG: NAD(P)/FAD-dependent oxidoreductase [Acidimicrobiales bacterium]|jgi:phytoene dehydrogenase-like protein